MRLVAFPYHDWRKAERWGFRNRDLHILRELDRHPAVDEVLVIDRPVSRAERLLRRGHPFAQGMVIAERRAGPGTARVTRVAERTAVLDVMVPDLIGPLVRRRAWWFDTFRDPYVLDTVAWATTVVDLGPQPGAIAWTPTVGPAIDRIAPAAFVYDSLDNWITHPTLRSQASEAREGYASLLPKATAVVAPSPASRDVLAEWSSKVRIIPNGVDVDEFREPRPRPHDLPDGPIVGYTGTLGVRIDPGLVSAVAERLPDVSFVFVGPVRERSAIREMLGRPNVTLLGERHYADLPAYLHHFDVGWIPHRVGEGETGGDPIKTWEYWAAGLQVVATRLDGLTERSDQLHLIGSADDGARVIRGLLDHTIPTRPTTVPETRTWTAIADQMIRLLDVASAGATMAPPAAPQAPGEDVAGRATT